jgi:hypothetical protein
VSKSDSKASFSLVLHVEITALALEQQEYPKKQHKLAHA